ncbi:hypothetical protein B0H14DRAFT_2649250, partial [Mycena olivaceomarginata]
LRIQVFRRRVVLVRVQRRRSEDTTKAVDAVARRSSDGLGADMRWLGVPGFAHRRQHNAQERLKLVPRNMGQKEGSGRDEETTGQGQKAKAKKRRTSTAPKSSDGGYGTHSSRRYTERVARNLLYRGRAGCTEEIGCCEHTCAARSAYEDVSQGRTKTVKGKEKRGDGQKTVEERRLHGAEQRNRREYRNLNINETHRYLIRTGLEDVGRRRSEGGCGSRSRRISMPNCKRHVCTTQTRGSSARQAPK